jgi:hypothetical protein
MNIFPGLMKAPKLFDYQTTKYYQENQYKLSIFDTFSGDEKLSFECLINTDIFIYCFALDDHNSFQNLLKKYKNQINQQDAKIILLGLKGDLRDNKIKNLVTKKMIKDMCLRLGAVEYIEVSSLSKKNISRVYKSCMLTKNKKFEDKSIKKHPNSSEQVKMNNSYTGNDKSKLKNLFNFSSTASVSEGKVTQYKTDIISEYKLKKIATDFELKQNLIPVEAKDELIFMMKEFKKEMPTEIKIIEDKESLKIILNF